MGSQILSGNMTTTTTTLIISFLVLAITLPHSQGFFLRDRYDSPSSRSSNQTEEEGSLAEDAILGVFDTVTGFTYGLEGIFEQFEDGFKKIRPQSDSTVTKKVSQNAEEEEDDSTLGSDAVVGLFDSLRNFNRQVGKLVGKVGDTLTDRRGNVERLASNIDSGLKNVGENFQDWKEDNFGISLRRKKETEKEAEAEDEDDHEAEDSDIE